MKSLIISVMSAFVLSSAAVPVLAQSVPDPVQLSKFAGPRAEANRLFSLACEGNGKPASSKAGASQVNDALNKLRKIAYESSSVFEVATAATALGNAQGYKKCYAHQVYREQFSKNSYSEEMAAKLHKAAAGYGYPVAMYNYGNRLVLGKGVSVNGKLGLAYLEAAYKGGYNSAALSLANHYMNAKSVTRDLKKAKYWLAKAKQAGDGISPASYDKALQRYNFLAGSAPKPAAKTKLAEAGKLQVYPMSLFEKERDAVSELYYKVCDDRPSYDPEDIVSKSMANSVRHTWSSLHNSVFKKGDPRNAVAIHARGRVLANEGCFFHRLREEPDRPRDLKEAAEYVKIAAEMGYPVAMNDYGVRLMTGKGVKANPSLGIAYLEGAIEGEYWLASTSLAQIYMSQKYGVHDLKKARYWLELSRKYNGASSERFQELQAQLKEMGG